MTKFKLGLIIVFSVFIVIGVIVFAASKGSGNTAPSNVTVWGLVSKNSFDSFIQSSTVGADKSLVVQYVQKTPANFENDFINALANGAGPDVIMISQDMMTQNLNKIFVIPYANYNQRTFLDSFIQEGELFLNKDGVVAVPIIVDPLTMYWNRDLFASAGIANPPKYWDEFLTLPSKLSQTDKAGNITQSTVAFGEWNNVTNAKAVLSQILLSAGSPIVDTSGASPQSALSDSGNADISPATASVNFFTQFANPTSQTYSWNRGMPSSLTYFLSGNLAVYFGFASELTSIRAKNPNLNFDVAFVPQPRQATKKVVFGKIYGLAIVKQSKSIAGAFKAISEMTDDASIKALSTYTNLPPVKRALLATPPADPYQSIFYQSALVSAGWLDPNDSATNQIFGTMIDSITSGQAKTSEAIGTANDALNSLFK